MQDLQPFHTFSIPAQANNIVEIHSIEQLKQAWETCQLTQSPVLLLGQGSNVLFLQDFKGTVLINRLLGIEHQQDQDFHYLHVNGGENWHKLVEWSLAQGIGGLENLALIPGCAGSAPIQNIGAYGVEFKDVCDYVEVLNLQNGEQFRLSNADCAFAYRDSIFKHQYGQGYAIVAIGLKLAKDWRPVLQYGALTKLAEAPTPPDYFQVFAEVCAIRRSKLPDPAQFGNAGSFFKNPVVSAQQFNQLAQDYPQIPHFLQSDGSVKLAAGWLIDQCGLKGYQIGGAAVHQQQALVLINIQQATGEDIRALAQYVREQVALQFGVYLEPEVRFIGEHGEVDAVQAISSSPKEQTMLFKEILEQLPTIDHLTELQVRQGAELIHTIPAIAGKLGSLRLYNALAEKFNRELNAQAAQQGLHWFAEHVQDAQQHPGKHPNIDLLFRVIKEDLSYQLLPISI